ncbi:MAG: tRNA (guanosine(37)-N1)-methyltransferase TrmD [Phycisphaerales bacterium]|nr:tRNA (guanosine(37)-N1)-methyltransferase TrmD [Phycisphaerales bacterium]
MRIDVLTLFPGMFPGVLDSSIQARAATGDRVTCHVHDIREWADNKHDKVDDRPFGGGPGMVLMCQPLWDAVHAVEKQDERPSRRILFTPQGQPLNQALVEQLAHEERLLLIAGHYEGVDERIVDELQPLEISIGDYVLTGGELPAMVLIDAVTRLQDGVLGHEDSAAEDSFSFRDDEMRLLDSPHYTRPRTWRDRSVPEVLLSGDHQAVADWRLDQMKQRTRTRRPDLLERREG